MEDTVILEPPLYFSEENVHIWNTSFHPKQNIMACSLINGVVEILKYDSEDVERVVKIADLHKSSVRWVTFNQEGTLLASCSEDKRLGFIDAEGKIAHIIKKAHSAPISKCEFVDEHIFMSGDDNGLIKLWDLRTTESIFEADSQSDAISGLRFDHEHTNILTSCQDGTVAIYDVKKGTDSQDKLFAISDSIDEELNGLEIMKNGKYLVCGSSESSLVIYKRDSIYTYCDRLQGFPGEVDALLKIDENTLLAGAEDGFVRGVGIKSTKILQTIGQHEQDENFPIQSLSLSYCGNIVASTSHDNSIKFYDVSEFSKKRRGLEPCKEQEASEQSMSASLNGEGVINKEKVKQETEMSEDQMQEEDSDDFEDDSDDSSDSMEEEANKKKKKGSNHKASVKAREKELKRSKQQSFFKGL